MSLFRPVLRGLQDQKNDYDGKFKRIIARHDRAMKSQIELKQEIIDKKRQKEENCTAYTQEVYELKIERERGERALRKVQSQVESILKEREALIKSLGL